MARTNWNRRFFASTRGQIIILLRRSSQTVEELTQALALTHTAVRTHLAALERDGLVQHHNERRGSGKPSAVYELAPEAAYLFTRSVSRTSPAGLLPSISSNRSTPTIRLSRKSVSRCPLAVPIGSLRIPI